jgi:hypothetical protein
MGLYVVRCSVTIDCCKEAICVTGRASPVAAPLPPQSALVCEKSCGKKTASKSHNIIYAIITTKIARHCLLEMSSETGIVFRGNIAVQFTEIRAAVLRQRNDAVTYRPIARQRLGKHIPARANALERPLLGNNRGCFLRGPCKVVIMKFSAGAAVEKSRVSGRQCRDMSLELDWVESSKLEAAE